MTIAEMLQKRAKLIEDARALYKLAEGEKRDLNAEERGQADKMLNDADALRDQADQLQKDEQRQARLTAAEAELGTNRGRQTGHNKTGTAGEARELSWKDGYGQTRSIQIAGPTAGDEYRQAFSRFLATGVTNGLIPEGETRALQADLPTAGGYVLPAAGFMASLIQAVDNEVFVRQYATVLPPIPASTSLGAPSLDADPADPTWVSELSIGSEDSTMAFGRRELKPSPLAQFIKVSKTLLRSNAISVDALVRQRLAYKASVVAENAYLNGTGAGQPLGIFTASALGISTARDVSTGNAATAVTYDGLIEAKFSLKSQYWQRARWTFHRDAVKNLTKLKDGEGRYIWQTAVTAGTPDMLLGFPVDKSEYAPNTFTTQLYVGALCDWSKYYIVDSLGMTIQVLLELYAATNQNGYLLRMESDGMPAIEEAFVRVKLA